MTHRTMRTIGLSCLFMVLTTSTLLAAPVVDASHSISQSGKNKAILMDEVEQGKKSFYGDSKAFAIVAPSAASQVHSFNMFDAPDEYGVNLTNMGIGPVRSTLARDNGINPGNFHNLDITTNTPRVQTSEDSPRFSFAACIRAQVTNGEWVENAIHLCKKLNPDVVLEEDQKRNEQILAAIPDPTGGSFSIHHGKISKDDFSQDAPATTANIATVAPAIEAKGILEGLRASQGDNQLPEGCDVSKDVTVMLSSRCLQDEDDIIMNRMKSIRRGEVVQTPLAAPTVQGALKLPVGLSQEEPMSELSSRDGKHSFFGNAPSKHPHFDERILDEENMPSTRRGNIDSDRASNDETPGKIFCQWSVGEVGTGLDTGSAHLSNVKACIRKALNANSFSDGISSISITTNGLTENVECHRHNGKDICAVVR